MKITVVIPVLDQLPITEEFCSQMLENTVLPQEVIILDNGSKDNFDSLVPKFKKLRLRVIHFDRNVGVNAAWNRGISEAKTELISVLNNDLIVSNFFFQKIVKTFKDPSVGITIPNTVKNTEEVYLCSSTKNYVEDFGPEEDGYAWHDGGWAWTIRTSVARKIEPIPRKLFRGCGDYYMFYANRTLGYRNIIMLDNLIFHYYRLTTSIVYSGNSIHDLDKEEYKIYKKIADNIQNYLIKE